MKRPSPGTSTYHKKTSRPRFIGKGTKRIRTFWKSFGSPRTKLLNSESCFNGILNVPSTNLRQPRSILHENFQTAAMDSNETSLSSLSFLKSVIILRMSISPIRHHPQSEKARRLVVILLKAHGLSLKVEPSSRNQASSLYPYGSDAYDAHTTDKASGRASSGSRI